MKKIIDFEVNFDKAILIILIDLTNKCNFNCEYCCSFIKNNDTLDNKWMINLIFFIKKISKLKKFDEIKINFLWWEPLLYDNLFFLISKLNNIEIKNIKFKIISNWSLIFSRANQIKNLTDKFWNDIKLSFLISFHFDEYLKKNKIKEFINWIVFLKKSNIEFEIKFLLPNSISLEKFLKIKEKIIKESNIENKNIILELIFENHQINSNSQKYSNEMLNYFEKNYIPWKNSMNIDINCKIKYEDWTFQNIKTNYSKLNNLLKDKQFENYKNYFCLPLYNENFVELHIDTNLNISTWRCSSINWKPFSIDEFLKIFPERKKLKYLCKSWWCPADDFLMSKKLINKKWKK